MVGYISLGKLALASTVLIAGSSCRDGTPNDSGSAVAILPPDALSEPLVQTTLDSPLTLRARRSLVNAVNDRVRLTPRVRDALLSVPRHLFVPPKLWEYSYDDAPLPISDGQTISQPTVVAMMTQALDLQDNERVLEIGTGSGYQAAVLAMLCKHVDSIEIIPSLAEQARINLRKTGYPNVTVHIGDGYEGLPSLAPFDAIIITAAPPQIPPKLLQQLGPGGRLVVPVGPQEFGQDLILVRKTEHGLSKINLGAVRFVPMVRGHHMP